MEPPSVSDPSETSSFMEAGSIEKEGIKQYEDENNNNNLLLDLSLSNKDSNQEDDHHSSQAFLAHDQGNNETDEPRVFSCNYCQRKFYSSQALGGHQNAHKRERTLAKRGQRTAGVFSNRYSSMASLPLHGSFNKSSLGVQVHTRIHKPPLAVGWSSRQTMEQQPAIGWLGMENFLIGTSSSSSTSTNSAARFHKLTPAPQGRTGLWWDGTINNFKTKQDELKLDLSLKL